MGKFDKILKTIGGAVDDVAGKVPYKIKSGDGELRLTSPKATASMSFRDPDTVQMLDPEVADFVGDNPVYLEALEAEKGFGSKALKTIEKSAKKRGADSVYLNASPLGGTRGLSQKEAAEKVRDFYAKNGYKVAEDMGTNTMMYKKLAALGLLAGGATVGGNNEASAAPSISNVKGLQKSAPQPGFNLEDSYKNFKQDIAEPMAGAWEKAKSFVTDPLSKALDLTKDGSAKEGLKAGLDIGLDPTNLLGGVPAAVAGGIQMMGSKDPELEAKKAALRKLSGE